ncbi:MAG: thiamine phosphate synthase, partial [Pseudomonadota bacterium]
LLNGTNMSENSDARLYLLLPPRFEPEEMGALLPRILVEVSVACVRLDLGPAPEEDWIRAANHLIGPCHAADIALVVTDHYRLAEDLGLDGVHLANSRTPVREVRKALGNDRIVGAWAGTSKHQGMVLAEAGADYVSLGPIGDTGALGDEGRAEDDLFAWWAEMIETPVVAEGGVTAEDAARLSPHTDFVVPSLDIWADTDAIIPALQAYAKALT